MLTITKLRYALALASTEHFGKAAEQCHVTQPTLSIGIATLEHWLGFDIFVRERQGRGVLRYAGTTEQGKQFLQRAAKVVADFDDLMKG